MSRHPLQRLLPLLLMPAVLAACATRPAPAPPAPAPPSTPGAESPAPPTQPQQPIQPKQPAPPPAPAMDPEAGRVADRLRAGSLRVTVPDLGLDRELTRWEKERLSEALRTAAARKEEAGSQAPQVSLPWDLALTGTGHGNFTLRWSTPGLFWLTEEATGRRQAFAQPDGGLYQAVLAVLATEMPLPSDAAQKIIAPRANAAVTALRERNWEALAALVHPTRGVRFSPYGHVDMGPEGDRVLTREALRRAASDPQVYTWGHFAGSGAPIRLTFTGYVERFVYDRDYARAPQVGYNRILGRGNLRPNWWQAYPGSILVDYHFPGTDPKYQGMDWRSLQLVFAREGDNWYLVGILHGEWTI